ncbi:MAG: PIN domain-containing protein [Chloroflexi bacterium]|nr:PIN domain-containing protein [Chloroflexota bacterium]
MPSLFLVDTSAWIFALRQVPVEAILRRIDTLLEMDVAATCGLVELELLGGAASEKEYSRLRSRLTGLHRLPIEETDWEGAARLAFSLRRTGVTVPFTDVLLSALALRYDAVLLHADRDFDLVAQKSALRVESLADTMSSL